MNTLAIVATNLPYDNPLKVFNNMSRTAAAIAEATTMMISATKRFGRKAMTPVRRLLTGFGPNTPKASCSTK